MNVCHSCVTSGYREGNVAPAFVPNGKWTHKEQGRGGRKGRGGGGQSRMMRRRKRKKKMKRWRSEGSPRKALEVQNITPGQQRVSSCFLT